MRARRLFVLVALVVAPAFAACGTLPTANDGPTPTHPADTTTRSTTQKRDQLPWT